MQISVCLLHKSSKHVSRYRFDHKTMMGLQSCQSKQYELRYPSFTEFGCWWFMVFNATFKNILIILWRSVLLVEEIEKTIDLSQVTSSNNKTLNARLLCRDTSLSQELHYCSYKSQTNFIT